MTTDLVHAPFGTWCLIHNRHEPDLPGDYRYCGECWHVFRTELELMELTYEIDRQTADMFDAFFQPRRTSGEEIYSCPLCCHDF